jgi:hypothetical protein
MLRSYKGCYLIATDLNSNIYVINAVAPLVRLKVSDKPITCMQLSGDMVAVGT